MDMNTTAIAVPTVPGTPFDGGFYVGRIRDGEELHAVIVSPRAGDLEAQAWGPVRKSITGAMSYYDGQGNTIAMAEAGSKLAKAILALDIAGKRDWYLPARDELELVYRHLKPGTYATYAWRNGDNPSSVPAGYPYTEKHPQTPIASFREGGADALNETWYWTSTQSAPDAGYAWFQYFLNGAQNASHESAEVRARAVRRVAIR